MKKKGIMLSQAFGAVLTLVLIGLLVIIAIYMFSSLQTSFPLVSQSIVNESATLSTSGYYLTNRTVCGYVSPVIGTVYNTTDGVVLSSGNWTFNDTSSKMVNTTKIVNMKVGYSYNWGGDACTASATTIVQFGTFPALVGLVGTIIFLSLVIGVLIASFAMGGRKGV